MNKVILMGRLARDPEVRYSNGANGQTAVARFSLAVDRRRTANSGDSQTADFISCVAFGKTAEFIEKFFSKGNRLVLCGRIMTGSYTNKDGQKVYTTDVVAEEVEFAESKGSNNQEGGFKPVNNGMPSSSGGFINMPDGFDEDLPFV